MNIFFEANDKLEVFIKDGLYNYHKLRNYDFGAKNRTNVSQISKYISHRILYEYEIIEKIKSIDKKKKFTDEILWRIYWKGYLENYKSIWNEYKNQKLYKYESSVLKNAMYGETGIDCFDRWVEELKYNNYLHNHARMWFASMWIFTFKLPWQLGARFFMKHLFDGDAASNTLSWRWVAGIHTNNKPYLASKENINKYTANRFKNIPIELTKSTTTSQKIRHQTNKIPSHTNSPLSNVLFMFDNDLNIWNRSKLFNSYSNVYIIFNLMIEGRIKLSENVSNFKRSLAENIYKLLPNSEIINFTELDILLNDYKCIDVIYPGVGSNLDSINNYSILKNIFINFIYREDDLKNWNYARSGFFKFKTSFYSINNIKSNST